jgi:DNA recombination protein RmuC
VKARGTWGEIQLGALLEQILTPEQYDKNVQTNEQSREVVEFAIRLPGQERGSDECVWLPIDSKFPQEDYIRLQEAADTANAEGVKAATTALTKAVRLSAQDIRDKYLNPPQTTDFAIMFLPTEGLYAEVLRQPGLVEDLQHTYRIVVAGPASLSAILTSLRMGFRTLAIEQRASEVWKVLAAVKTEFGRFGETLDRLRKQLDTATRTVEQTGVRTRAMERRLREVEQLPSDTAADVLKLSSDGESVVSDEDENEALPEEDV